MDTEEPLKNTLNTISQQITEENFKVILIILTIITVLIGLFIWLFYYTPLITKECNKMEKNYGNINGRLSSINTNKEQFSHSIKDYYIQTAYNCCSGGNYSNDYVNTCVLKNILKQGVRCLDFEIYSINDEPVVATSTSDKYNIKQTFNSIPFSEIMEILSNYAFSGASTPCPSDPLFIHLRIKSDNKQMYDNFAKLFEKYNDLFLGKKYSYSYYGKNLGDVPLTQVMGKIVVIVDNSNPSFIESEDFYEYVNLTSNSKYMKLLRYYDVKFETNNNELIDNNKTGMTIVVPDNISNPENSKLNILTDNGCQFIAVRYQLYDTNCKETINFFNSYGHSFVLKPAELRNICKKNTKHNYILSQIQTNLDKTVSKCSTN